MPPEFQIEKEGIHLAGMMNQEKVRFDFAFGREAIIYKWNPETLQLETTSDKDSWSLCSKNHPITEQRLCRDQDYQSLVNKVTSLEEGIQRKDTEYKNLQESYSKLFEDSNRKLEELMQKHTTLIQSLVQNYFKVSAQIGADRKHDDEDGYDHYDFDEVVNEKNRKKNENKKKQKIKKNHQKHNCIPKINNTTDRNLRKRRLHHNQYVDDDEDDNDDNRFKEEWFSDLQINAIISKWSLKNIFATKSIVRLYNVYAFIMLKQASDLNKAIIDADLSQYNESYALFPINYYENH